MAVKIKQDKGLNKFDWFVVIRGNVMSGGQEETRSAAVAAGKRSEKKITKRKGGDR